MYNFCIANIEKKHDFDTNSSDLGSTSTVMIPKATT